MISFTLAWRYLFYTKSARLSILLSLASTIVATASFVVVLSVVTGFQLHFIERITNMNGHMSISGNGLELGDIEKITSHNQIKKAGVLSNLTSAHEMLNGEALLIAQGYGHDKNNKISKGVLIKGIEKLPKGILVTDKENEKFTMKKNGILLGKYLINILGISKGRDISLIVYSGASPKMFTFEVVGTFDAGTNFYNENLALISMENAQLIFSKGKNITEAQLFFSDPYDIPTEKIKKNLSLLPKKFKDKNLIARDWTVINSGFFSALELERLGTYVVLFFVLLISSLSILSSTTLLMREKVKDIALIRNLGGKISFVLRVFLWVGFIIGSIGSIIGLTIGTLISLGLPDILALAENTFSITLWSKEFQGSKELPVNISYINNLGILFLNMLLSVCVAFYPAWQASRIALHKVLRN